MAVRQAAVPLMKALIDWPDQRSTGWRCANRP
jgi:hypothetical protein